MWRQRQWQWIRRQGGGGAGGASADRDGVSGCRADESADGGGDSSGGNDGHIVIDGASGLVAVELVRSAMVVAEYLLSGRRQR